MKKTPTFLMALATALLLSASGVAVAQSDMGNAPTTGATFSTGIVESFGTNSVTIKRDSGESVTYVLDNATIGKANLANGSRVRIDYVTNDQGQTVAKEIQINADAANIAATPATEVDVDTTADVKVETTTPAAPAPSATYTAPAPAAPMPDTTADVDVDTTMDTTIDTDRDTLPATASRLPAFALLGLVALAAGLAVRFVR